jgi:hypothetical protein
MGADDAVPGNETSKEVPACACAGRPANSKTGNAIMNRAGRTAFATLTLCPVLLLAETVPIGNESSPSRDTNID